MKSRLTLTGLLLVSSPSFADPGAFFGVTYNFGGGIGLSLKVLSTNEEDQGAASLGVSYYPLTQDFGIDLGGAYLDKDVTTTASWDILNNQPQLGIGYVNTVQRGGFGATGAADGGGGGG